MVQFTNDNALADKKLTTKERQTDFASRPPCLLLELRVRVCVCVFIQYLLCLRAHVLLTLSDIIQSEAGYVGKMGWDNWKCGE